MATRHGFLDVSYRTTTSRVLVAGLLAMGPACRSSTTTTSDSTLEHGTSTTWTADGSSPSGTGDVRPDGPTSKGGGEATTTTSTTAPTADSPAGSMAAAPAAHYVLEGTRTSSVGQDEIRGTLTVRPARGADQEVVFLDESVGQETTTSLRWEQDRVVAVRVVTRLRSANDTTSDCTWQPPRMLMAANARVGSAWTSTVSCTDVRPTGNAERNEADRAQVVREDTIDIAGTKYPALVVHRTTTLRSNQSEATQDVEEWFVPRLGVFARQKTATTRSGRTTTTEWRIVRQG